MKVNAPVMRDTRVMLIDAPGLSRDVLGNLIAGLPRTRLVSHEPDVVVLDDRLFNDWMTGSHHDVPLVVIGADIEPAYARRAYDSGAVAWIAKENAAGVLPGLLTQAIEPA